MHIAYISYEYPKETGIGGIGTYTWQMAKAIAGLGHSVEVFTASHIRQISEWTDSVLVHRVLIMEQIEFNWAVVFKFSEQEQYKPFDIIECAEIGANALLVKEKFPNIPLIVRLHTPAVLVVKMLNSYNSVISKIRFVIGALIRGRLDLGYWANHDKNQNIDPDYLITEKADLITAPSNAMKKWAVDFWKIEPERIKVIPNPFTASETLLNIPNNSHSKTITFMGRLNVLKGIVALTKALPKVLRKHPDWKMCFIGSNGASHIQGKDMKTWMQEQLKDFKNQIEFIDWIDYNRIPEFYSQTEICVFPSLFESFSYVCAEAMSAGKAIIGSKNGGMFELLDNGKCGILVDPGGVKEIAAALNSLIENPELRIEYGRKARKRIIEEYEAEKIGKRMENLYKNLVKKTKENGHIQ